VTTIHLALVVLGHHRRRAAPTVWLTLVSLAFAGSPWVFPTVAQLALGVSLHIGWFLACAGFPTTCESSHRATDTSWTQGRFTHRFPLTGPHNVPCAQCHTTPNTFVIYSCTVCHDRTRTDEKHRGVSGYRYDSTACFACHPNGRP
jgi:hypothetical protein